MLNACSKHATSTLNFAQDNYYLKLSTRKTLDDGYINEYRCEKDSPKRWHKLIGVYSYPYLSNPKQTIFEFEKTVKTFNAEANPETFYDEKTNEGIINFVISSENGRYVELNIFKYAQNPSGGLLVFQFSKRVYNDEKDFDDFKKNLFLHRKNLTANVSQMPMPAIVKAELAE